MAKRRNPKKEKALRNQAYARKFRKRSTYNRMGRRRPGFGHRDESDMETTEAGKDTGAAILMG